MFNLIKSKLFSVKHTEERIEVAFAPICRIYHLEVGTIEHKLALTSLILVEHTATPTDHQTFTDNGDLALTVLYNDYCKAYAKEIRKEQTKRLRVLDF